MKRCPECRGVGSIADPERGNAIGPTIVCSMCKGNKSVIDSDEKWLDRVEARWNDLGNISVEDAHDLLVLARRALAAEAELARLREGEGELIATIVYHHDKQLMEVIREPQSEQEKVQIQSEIAKNLQDRIGVTELEVLAGAWQERTEKAEAELARVHAQAAAMREALQVADECAYIGRIHDAIVQALSGDAGKGLLTRLERREKQVSNLKELLELTVKYLGGYRDAKNLCNRVNAALAEEGE